MILRRLLPPLAAVALLLGLAGCAVNPVTGRSELALFQISEGQEVDIGKKAFPSALQQMGGQYPDPQLDAYINQVGGRLARLSQRPDLPWQFRVVNDSAPNAFAMPGGHIAISRGLLVSLENEAQLAAVLGHEIAHVTARHSVQGMQRGTLLNVALGVLSGATKTSSYGSLAMQTGQLAAQLLDSSYSREQERESDRLGIDYIVLAGYNPRGAVELQEFFYRQIEGGAEPQWLAGLFRSHPFSRERMLANEDYAATNYARVLQDPQFRLYPEAFGEAAARLKGLKGAYESYDEARTLEGRGELGKAVAKYLEAAAAGPDEALILTGLGMAYLKSEDMASARIHLKKAVQLDSRYYYSQMGLGYVLVQQGESSRALPHLEASMELMPSLQGAYLLGEAYDQNGERDKAIELYRAVAQADPKGKLGRSAAARVAEMERL